jgi:hypothetical protein
MDDEYEYYIINYNATELCQEQLKEYGDKSVIARINMVAHAFLFPDAQIGQEIKATFLANAYTS